MKIVIPKAEDFWFKEQILFDLPENLAKTPTVKRRKKQQIPRITTVRYQANGTEDPVQRENETRRR